MITLASDFGTPYPAAMRGVILSRTDARIVDVAHDFPQQDVRTAAFWLREVLPWFPPAVHCAVIDPGVGTDRDALAVRVGDHALVAPDNGLALPAARELRDRGTGGDETPSVEPFRVQTGEPASNTFHGRDVFAPAAAEIHDAGVDAMEDVDRLEPLDDCEDLRLPGPTLEEDRALGEVLVVDGFGNAITNVPGDVLEGCDAVAVNGNTVPVARSFAGVDPGRRLTTVGSHGNVELSVNRGRGDEAFGLAPGEEVRLEFDRD